MTRLTIFLIAVFSINISQSQSVLYEEFENWPPSSWEIYELGDALDGWIQDWQGISHTGHHSAYSGIDNSQCDNWLVSSQVNIENDSYELRFWETSTDTFYYDKASVWISSGSPNPVDGDFEEVFESLQNVDVWKQRLIDLSNYNGESITVAFRYEGTWHNWFVDDVTIAPSLFVDGALTEIVNPKGVSTIATTEDVIVTLRNFGNSVIDNADIEWTINGESQEVFNGSNLIIQPNESIDISLGSYNFEFNNTYEIIANLTVNDDFESLNNTIEGKFDVGLPRDGFIVSVKPEGMAPNVGLKDVSTVVRNIGNNVIDIAEITWSVNDVEQTPYLANNIGLQPGQTIEIVIGQYNFTTGLHELSVKINAFGDINPSNDTYLSFAAIDIFWESFEGQIFPPENWSIEQGVLDNINFDFPVHGDKYYTSVPEWSIFYNISDTLFTPLLDIKTGDKFNFYLKGSSFFSDNTSLVWKDGITDEIHLIQDISSPSNSWEKHEINISSAAGTNYIGIINGVSGPGSNGQSKFDLFTSDAKLHVGTNDLGITNGDIHFLAKENISENYLCTIKNFGINTVLGSDYRVKLMELPGIEIASAQGANLSTWEEVIISIDHTFTSIGKHRLYFEIEYASDEDLSNNLFRGTTISVVPNTILFNSIGDENGTWTGLPFNASPNSQTLGEDDLSQALYYADEFEVTGDIYGIIYNYDNLFVNNTIQKLPLKVWVGQTAIPDLTNGWIPGSELELVYNDTIEILPGFGKQLFIPFDAPIQFTGFDNFVIQHYQYDPEYPASLLRFENNYLIDGPLRSIQASDVYFIDPDNPPDPDSYYLTQNMTYATMVMDPTIEEGLVSGVVYNMEGIPLSDAIISVEGTSISEISSGIGEYEFPPIPYGEYVITASKFGYFDENESVMLNSESVTRDYFLSERAKVDVIGRIVGSNNMDIPLEFVDVKITGYLDDITVTDNNGDFMFFNVYEDNKEYQLSLFLYGYEIKTVQATVSNSTLNLGIIVLDQELLSPFDVVAEKNNGVEVSWQDALDSDKIKIQNDLGYDSNGYANEPNEEVWLGNVFDITEITTLTSIEITTYYIESVADFVTIDVIDIASNEILASSDPFLIEYNSVKSIDIPNIVVLEDIAVMVHWQNNAMTTNFLTVDYSDTLIQNTAAIRYPNQPVQLLSDFLGNGQSQSFHVRLNTLDNGDLETSNEILTYNVYRGLANEFPNISSWDLLNEEPISSLTFNDNAFPSIDTNEIYRYAVETIYTEGFSKVTFSNEISGTVVSTDNILDVDSHFEVFPVPTRKFINIRSKSLPSKNLSISIVDILGNQVEKILPLEIQDGIIKKNLSHYSNGIYFIVFEIDDKKVYKKIIVSQ
ncbi:MAG: hypothetical protein ACI9P5_002076 [Saprospiraceae bacterium]|jgi:hypothetical protein